MRWDRHGSSPSPWLREGRAALSVALVLGVAFAGAGMGVRQHVRAPGVSPNRPPSTRVLTLRGPGGARTRTPSALVPATGPSARRSARVIVAGGARRSALHMTFPAVRQPRAYEVGPATRKPGFRALCVECGGTGVVPAFGRLGPLYDARTTFFNTAPGAQIDLATWNF